MERLPERDRTVIELRFGLAYGTARTADQVAASLGVTRQRARQAELRALLSLGNAADASGLEAAA
jgi:RNA polymerase primary sigma factor